MSEYYQDIYLIFHIIKKPVKYAYSVLIYLLYVGKDKFLSNYEVNRVYPNDNFECFGGYYDKNPQNDTGLVSCNLLNHDTSRKPNY